VIQRLRPWFRDLGGEPALVLCAGMAFLVICHHQGSTDFFRMVTQNRWAKHPAGASFPFFWWFGMSWLMYFVAPLLSSWITGGSFTRSYGLGLGDWKVGLTGVGLLLAVMLPGAYLASTLKAFSGVYPLAGQGAFSLQIGGFTQRSWALFTAYELAYASYFVAWEFFFRGWMLNALLPRFGRAAVLIQTAPFALMHLGKPELEVLGSIPAGVALGLLALRTRSFWYGALLHALIAVWMDVLAALPYLLKA
jgi:membrane protease YdiL (CAAX protease family)